MEKKCQSCGNVFYKRKHESKKYWERKLCCSATCANIYKTGKFIQNSGQFKKGHIPIGKGKPLTADVRKKISESCKGRPSNNASFFKGMISPRKGKKFPNQTGEKNKKWSSIEKTCIVCKKKYFVQKYRSDKSRFCSHNCYHMWNKGENNPQWTDNYKKRFKYKIMGLIEYKEWRFNVFLKDNFKCCNCDSKENIEAHHIKSYYSIVTEHNITTVKQARECKELWDIKNGQTLCRKCHRKTDSYGRLKKLS